MVFSDSTFFYFFAVYLAAQFLAPSHHRIWLIVLGSSFFYGYFRPSYLWIPIVLATIAHAGTYSFGHVSGVNGRRIRVTATIIALLSPLAIYKYYDFFTQSLVTLGVLPPIDPLQLSLPLGISFISFTLIAYVVDVYRARYPREKNFLYLFGYIMFFPQLIAGPILKPKQLLPQLHNPLPARAGNFRIGAAIFVVGLVKKVLVADNIAPLVDSVYAASGHGLLAQDYLFAIYGFSIQIYCDFSGYTDMAIGLGHILGVSLPRNFGRPYLATSPADFWRRWHITLSFWLRDYLYIPLGGNRGHIGRTIRNITITMLLGGLWHGANWTFVLWGALHALAIAATHLARTWNLRKQSELTPTFLRVFLTFNFVTALWVFFRAPDLTTAVHVLRGPFLAQWGPMSNTFSSYAFPAIMGLLLLLVHPIDDHRRIRFGIRNAPPLLLWSFILLGLFSTLVLSGGQSAAFIYFDF